jgi:hypothetical protein
MTALSILQDASSRLGLTAPSAVFSSTDAQIIQLRNLMNMEGKMLALRAAWTKITKEKTFSTTAAAAQTSSVPSDFGYYINDTMWNRTTDRQIVGPLSAEQWQAEQAVGVASAIEQYFRFRGAGTDAILLGPGTPTASQTVAYEYVSNQWCEAAGGTDQSALAVDTDVGLLSEELITLGVIWRFKAAKGFDYGEDFRTYEMEVAKAIARDGGKPRVNIAGGYEGQMYRGNIPEGNWTL